MSFTRTVQGLDENRFVVRKELRYVKEYSNKDRWLNLSKSDVQEINNHLSHLQPASKDDDELARRFDMLILIYQILLLSGSDNTGKYTWLRFLELLSSSKERIISLKYLFIFLLSKRFKQINIGRPLISKN